MYTISYIIFTTIGGSTLTRILSDLPLLIISNFQISDFQLSNSSLMKKEFCDSYEFVVLNFILIQLVIKTHGICIGDVYSISCTRKPSMLSFSLRSKNKSAKIAGGQK